MRTSLRFYIVALATLFAWSLDEAALRSRRWCGRRGRRVARSLALALALAAAGGAARAAATACAVSLGGDGNPVTEATPGLLPHYGCGYDIVELAGTLNNDSITDLVGAAGPAIVSSGGFFIYDDVLYPTADGLAAGGIFGPDGSTGPGGFAAAATDRELYAAGARSPAGGFFGPDGLWFSAAANGYVPYFPGGARGGGATNTNTGTGGGTEGGAGGTDTITAPQPHVVSEPSAFLLFGAALLGWRLIRARRAGDPAARTATAA